MKLHEHAMPNIADRQLIVLGLMSAAGRAQDGRPTTEQLSSATGIAKSTLSPNYRSDRSPETIGRIGAAAAQLLADAGLLTSDEAERLTPWLLGHRPDTELEEVLKREASAVRCTWEADSTLRSSGVVCPASIVPGVRPGWFVPDCDGDRYEHRLRMCRAHVRAKQSPTTAHWEEDLAKRLPAAPLPPERRGPIVQAFDRLRRNFEAVKYSRWAEGAGLEEKELRSELHRAGLPEKPRAGKKHFNRFVVWPALAFSSAALPWWLLELKLSEPARRFARLIPSLRWPPGAPDWRLGERLRRWLVGPAPTPALRLATVRA